MPLINSINGSLLKTLAVASGSGSSGSSGASTIGGKGVSTSFEGDSVDLGSGLATAATAFSRSYIRVSGAVSRLDVTQETLSTLTDILERMSTLATQSADAETTTEDRATINSEYESLVTEFESTFSDASKLLKDVYGDTIDVLDVSDLQNVLQDAGVDLSAETTLSEAFSAVGGGDGDVGYERVTLEDGTEVDPLAQTIDTRENAINAKDALSSLRDAVGDDVDALSSVLTELRAAQSFAYHATLAAQDLSSQILDSNQADEVASRLVSKIKQQASDPALAPHSSLDTELSLELLGSS